MTGQHVTIGKEPASIGELIGKGAEGEVYAIKGCHHQVIKIYNKSNRIQREDKLRAMVASGLADTTDLIAYPAATVTSRSGDFLGFAMKFMPGYHPLHELYSPKSRQLRFPKADYRFMVRVAVNVARAVGQVHRAGCVIGDLNHSGVLVAQNATVALIDADSFQFISNGKSYPCVVGVPDYTPPELHGIKFASIQRTAEHDHFGLAVAIFHLLLMGRHPYAGCYSGPDISLAEAIAQNRFAYSLTRRADTQTSPPPGTLPLNIFPTAIVRSFENAFGTIPSARPSALDWIRALETTESFLTHCKKARTHFYPRNSESCVWCQLASRSGFDMFPDMNATSTFAPTDERGTEQAIREILAYRFPTADDLLPVIPPPAAASETLQNAIKVKLATQKAKKRRAPLGLVIIGISIAGIIFALPALLLWLGLAMSGWYIFRDRKINDDDIKIKTTPYIEAYRYYDSLIHTELNNLAQQTGISETLKVRKDLDTIIQSYREQNTLLASALRGIISKREIRQRKAYLDSFSIRNAGIAGIGYARLATLRSFGVETAADVTDAAIKQIPGFGNTLTLELTKWRRELESRFNYNPAPSAGDFADENAVRLKFSTQKAQLETLIRNGLSTLRTDQIRFRAASKQIAADSPLAKALNNRAQAERDLLELGAHVPPSIVKLNIEPSSV